MPDFGYDVKLAVVVDGEKKEEIPNSPIGQDNKYYEVQVDCTSSKTSGLWDYNAWRLNLDYIESNSKCNLTFTSSMSKEEYDKYIQAGVALRRNTYRGKDITEYKDLPETNPMNLYNQIESGTFNDIYVGDYIRGSNEVTWLIADLDNYLYTGDLKTHHVTIIPANNLKEALMNSQKNGKETTEGGYLNSEMVTKTLGKELQSDENTILGKYIYPDFKNHVLEYNNFLTNKVDDSLSNMYGSNSGASSNWKYEKRYLDLMSEVNVFGSLTWSSSGYDIGIDNRQYAIFHLKPELINHDLDGNIISYWLKTVSTSYHYTIVHKLGVSSPYDASHLDGVRPRFLID